MVYLKGGQWIVIKLLCFIIIFTSARHDVSAAVKVVDKEVSYIFVTCDRCHRIAKSVCLRVSYYLKNRILTDVRSNQSSEKRT